MAPSTLWFRRLQTKRRWFQAAQIRIVHCHNRVFSTAGLLLMVLLHHLLHDSRGHCRIRVSILLLLLLMLKLRTRSARIRARILRRPDVRKQFAAGHAIAFAMEGQRMRQATLCEMQIAHIIVV